MYYRQHQTCETHTLLGKRAVCCLNNIVPKQDPRTRRKEADRVPVHVQGPAANLSE
jgi:hypothetical protein